MLKGQVWQELLPGFTLQLLYFVMYPKNASEQSSQIKKNIFLLDTFTNKSMLLNQLT